MYKLLGGAAHKKMCASSDLCAICGLHDDLRSICNSVTYTTASEIMQVQPAEPQTATADETTIDATFYGSTIGIKFGRHVPPEQKARAPSQIIELTAGGEAQRNYDGILQVGMTLTKIQGVLMMNQIGYSHQRISWVGKLIRESDRPLVLTFQRTELTADQAATLIE